MVACLEGHYHIVQMLVDKGAHVDLQNEVLYEIFFKCVFPRGYNVISYSYPEGCLSIDGCLQDGTCCNCSTTVV